MGYPIKPNNSLTRLEQRVTDLENEIIDIIGSDVESVFGRTGVVVAATNDYTWAQVDKTTSSLADLTTKSAGALTSGTLDNARLDTELQALAGLTSAANKVPYFTGSGTAGVLDFKDEDNMASDSATAIPSQQSVKAYADSLVVGLFDFKGSTDCSSNPNYPTASKGDAYVVSVAGKIGGASGKSVDVGDVYMATADNAGGTEASVGTSWTVLEHNLVGALLAANNLSDVASASSARTNLGLAIGTDVQAYDAELAALAGLTSAADKVPYFTGSGTAAVADFTSFGRSLVDDANAAAARTTLELGTIATQASSNVSITGGSITGITDLAVADGGTGASTLTGILKGNGTSAFTAVTAPSGAIVGDTDTQTLSAKTLTSPILQGQMDGWIAANETWTYASATTFTISGVDRTGTLNVGDKIKLTQTSAKYFYITAITFSTNTTVTVNGGSDYSLANAAITSPYYSKDESPNGFPDWFNFTPTYTGVSSAQTGMHQFNMKGRSVTIFVNRTNNPTSNSTAFTMNLPVSPAATVTDGGWIGYGGGANNGVASATQYKVKILTAGTVANFYRDFTDLAWTNSGAKGIDFTVTYKV